MKATLSTPLAEFISECYVPSAKYVRVGGTGRAALKKLRGIVNKLTVMLGREPLVSDLSQSTIDQLEVFLRGAGYKDASRQIIQDFMLAMWRFATDLNLSLDAAPPRKKGACHLKASNRHKNARSTLSEAEGTLWHICVKRYFPVCIRIRTAKTKHQYHMAMRDFRAFLGHEPTAADLTDDNVTGCMIFMADHGLAPRTINGRRANLNALWNWMAKRRMVEAFPSNQKMHEPKRTPRAWKRDELTRLIVACRSMRGRVRGIPACLWWEALHLVIWDCGERITAVLAFRWDWLDLATGEMQVPAECRKGQESDMTYRLSPESLAALKLIAKPERDLLFPWALNVSQIWSKYKVLRKRAGLGTTHRDSFHKMRRSVASYVQAAGHDASIMLGHSSPEITRKSYLDTSITGAKRPSDVLFPMTPPIATSP